MNNLTAIQILQTMKSGHDLNEHLAGRIQQGVLSNADLLLFEDISSLLHVIDKFSVEFEKPHRVQGINDNLRYYIEKLARSVEEDQLDVFVYDFRFHYCSLYRLLELEIAYVVESYVNPKDYALFYPDVTKVDHEEILKRGNEAPFKVSVVLLAYNNLEYTRNCVESILRNTNDVEYELILVNNGSSDGTKAYFDSIPGAKVIHLEHNIHLVKGFNIGLMAAEGKYSAAVCNDFIFPPKWLSNVLVCIESDPGIGFASPGATSISNLQMINIPFHSIEDFEQRAAVFNQSDPSKWEERVVLLPNVLCCPTALLEQIGYYDTRFYRGEFLDDDISFKIRRAGYKLVYCGDTVTHHYGSITTASDHQTNSLEEGRKIFVDKYGLDAWNEARVNPANTMLDYSRLTNVESILGVDVKCGSTLLQIKNKIWSNHGIKPDLVTCSTNFKYEADLHSISNEVYPIDNLHQISELLNEQFDVIYIEQPLDYYMDNIETVFHALGKVLKPDGQLIFVVTNMVSLESFIGMLNNDASLHNRKVLMTEELLSEAAAQQFSPIQLSRIPSARRREDKVTVENLSRLLARENPELMSYLQDVFNAGSMLFQMAYQAHPATPSESGESL